jgi:UPF0716 protein FxsA
VVPALALAFIIVPLAELAVIVVVGKAFGFLATFALLLGFSLLGAWLARRAGWAAWRRFQVALAQGRVPTAEVADGAMVLLAGALLLTPGFITDMVGLLLLLPQTRALARRRVPALARRRRERRAAGRGRVGVRFGEATVTPTTTEWGTPEVGPPTPGATPRRGDPPAAR